MRESMNFQDLTASVVSAFLVAGILCLAVLEKDIPPSLTVALGSATTWLFIRAAAGLPKPAEQPKLPFPEPEPADQPELPLPKPTTPLRP